jgi:multiple sugar transport system permease protein
MRIGMPRSLRLPGGGGGLAGRFFIWLMVGLLLFWSLLPIIWDLLSSIKSRTDIFANPPKFFFDPDFSSYTKFLGGGSSAIWPQLTNSVVVSLLTTLTVLLLGSLAAYALSRFTFKGRNYVLFSMLAMRLLPPVTAAVPLFLLANSLKLVDTQLVLVLIYAGINLPFAVWMLKTFFDGVPAELEQAAQIDGATPLQALRHITLPLAAPGLGSTAIFVMVLAWNEFMFAFLFTSVNARTLPLLIAEGRGDDQIYWQDIATLSSILIIPVLLFSLLMQRHLVRGLSTGALK